MTATATFIVDHNRPYQPLRGNEPGSFAEHTFRVRLPGIARRVLEQGNWPEQTRRRLAALIADLPHGVIRLLSDPDAPDLMLWDQWLQPLIGQTFLDAPWLPAEIYFFRRILEATGYFQPGPGFGVDPYLAHKQEGREVLETRLADAGQSLAQFNSAARLKNLTALLQMVVWGNQADLSLWPAGGESPADHDDDQYVAHLVVDDAPPAANYILNRSKPLERIDFILDNVGLELAYDLLAADYLLREVLAEQVIFHAKPFPTYVSDATIPDIHHLVDLLANSIRPMLREMGSRLQIYLHKQQLDLRTNYCWIAPLSMDELQADLHAQLAGAGLVISKGDANYRRWVGDKHWPYATPLAKAVAFHPAPLLLLRVLKSESIAGLPTGLAEVMFQKDPDWLFNGSWGVIQFLPV